MSKNIVPEVMAPSFTCPFCDTTSKQVWYFNASAEMASSYSSGKFCGFQKPGVRGRLVNPFLEEWGFAQCSHCDMVSVWHKDSLVYPHQLSIEQPSVDMPEDVRKLYYEAANVLTASPKSAAALLRLSLQVLLNDVLGDNAKGTINENIKQLKEADVPNKVIKALDVVRVFGNESLHPGTINLDDDIESAKYLFVVLNIIVEALYTQPKRLDELFNMIPEQKRNASND